jgi:hypothetical protein
MTPRRRAVAAPVRYFSSGLGGSTALTHNRAF